MTMSVLPAPTIALRIPVALTRSGPLIANVTSDMNSVKYRAIILMNVSPVLMHAIQMLLARTLKGLIRVRATLVMLEMVQTPFLTGSRLLYTIWPPK